MAKSRTHDHRLSLTCPACQGKGLFHTWDCIDGTNDKAMRQRVLTDEGLFFYECPHCHEQIHVESPCLYINSRNKWMVWHIPDPKVPVTSQEVCDFLGKPSFSDYTCRAALTWGEWREKIIEMESAYDDRLYELIKYGAYQLLSDADKKRLPLEAYHIDYRDEGRQADALSLVFMDSRQRGMGYTYAITDKVKSVTQDLFLPMLDRLPTMNEKGRFDRFGYTWAQQMMNYVMKAAAAGKGKDLYHQLLGFWAETLKNELFRDESKA